MKNLRMFPSVTTQSFFPPLSKRIRRALRSASGAFDLPSIITGVVVVGILAAGVFAAIFGVIPFAQDHGARQDLSAVRTAEGVAKVKDGKYLPGEGLADAGYLQPPANLAIDADAAGSCWVGIVQSGSSAAFYATSMRPDPMPYAPDTDTGCLDVPAQEALAASVLRRAPAGGTAPPVIKAAGYVSAWGANNYGQLGHGDGPQLPTPTDVLASGVMAGKTVSALSAGGSHSCALASGAVYCWGNNSNGKLGDGTTLDSSIPVAVRGALAGKTVTALSAGMDHTCAVADGAAYCWGANSLGYLGTGNATSSPTPVAVNTAGALAGKTISAISAGDRFTCAIADGAAYCWGGNFGGMLGNNTTTSSSLPVHVNTSGVLAGKTVTAITTGYSHTCAIADGAAYCWGVNAQGQLGNNSVVQSNIPVAVSTAGALAGKTVTSIAAGSSETSCAVAGGAAYCWGSNTSGVLGNGTTVRSTTPAAVSTMDKLSGKTVSSVSAGYGHVCAAAEGSAYCWGLNARGQLGNGSAAVSNVPVAVTNTGALAGKTVATVDAGAEGTCALANGAVYCWGLNTFGQVGNNTFTNASTPAAVTVASVLAGKTVDAVSTGYEHSCALAEGSVYCWGLNADGALGNGTTGNGSQVPVAVTATGVLAGKTVTAISTGFGSTCAIADDALYCWGLNSRGQLGTGNTTRSTVPVAVTGLTGKKVTSLDVGSLGACAVADGAAYCWGDNASGQLGNGTITQSNVPKPVTSTGVLAGKTVSAVSAGSVHSCAIADGAAYCWGSNGNGRLGDASIANSNVPVAVGGPLSGKTVAEVSAGLNHTCAVSDNTVYCWGDNATGQLGIGTTTPSNIPVAVATSGVLAGKKVSTVSSGDRFTCVLAEAAPYCWGTNFGGQLGDGTLTQRNAPVAVNVVGTLAGKEVRAVTAGGTRTVAIYK